MAKGQYLSIDPQMAKLVGEHSFEDAHVPALVADFNEALSTIAVSLGTMLSRPQSSEQAIATMRGHLLLAFLLGFETGENSEALRFGLGISPWGDVLLEDDDAGDWKQAGDSEATQGS